MAKTGKRRRTNPKSLCRGKLDFQKALSTTGIEFHLPGYQFAGPGTKLQKRLALGQMGKNHLNRIARTHNVDYGNAKSLKDKWIADDKMIRAISNLPGKKIVIPSATNCR